MRLQTNLVRRGSRFYYRARVPEDLKQHYGKSEFLLSLKTSDKQQADYLLAQLKAQLFCEYAQLRNQTIPKDPLRFTPKPHQVNSPTIEHLIEYWISQSEKRPRTLMEAHTARKRLQAIVGSDSAVLIEKHHVIALKDQQLAKGLAPATIQKQINLLRAIFEVAMSNDLIEVNPFINVKIIKAKVINKPRVPFSTEDLKRIFNSPIFNDAQRPLGGAGEAAIWLPRIALWSGMRLEEIGQLLVSDVGMEQGISFISISADAVVGKHLKTASSNRRVPIHPELIKLGFQDYVTEMRSAGFTRLFPMLKSAGCRQLTSSWSQWFSRYLRIEIGITDRRKSFHSFRHGFKDACRRANIPKDIHDQITGHVSSDIGDSYGADEYPLEPLYFAIMKVRFDA